MEHYSHPRAITALYRTYQHLLRKRLEGIPVSVSSADYLRVVANEPGITLCELATLLGVSAPAATQVISALERDGMLRRETDKSDKRVKRLFLDTAGETVSDELNEVFDDFIAYSCNQLSEEENEELERLLKKMFKALQGRSEEEK